MIANIILGGIITRVPGIKVSVTDSGIVTETTTGASHFDTGAALVVNGQRLHLGYTLAELEALGTEDNIAVGDVAWDATNQRMLQCLVAEVGTSSWGYKRTFTVAPNMISSSTNALRRWCYWYGSTTVGTYPDIQGTGRLCMWPTRVVSVMYWSSSSHGDVVVSTHLNGTQHDIAELEGITGSVPAQTATQFNFTTASSYEAGDYIGLAFDPSNNRTGDEPVYVTVELEETVTLSSS